MTDMPKQQANRKRLLIDPQVQWALALRVLMHWGMLMVCLLMANTMLTLLSMAGEKPLTGAVGEAVRHQVPLMLVLLVLIPVFIRDTLKLSNRFAGPMYRLRIALKELGGEKGEARPLKLRDGDYWQEVAGEFNVVRDRIEQLEAEIQTLRMAEHQPTATPVEYTSL
ncbi:hypothetical protein [Crateriforma conspicua]|uniref:hypothetical protein n=1 Tax=Crateriforma conspicua TaxID=2527996 RepID=UPI0011A8174D|nr:hypothetical protein [Crateriforma conspicua]